MDQQDFTTQNLTPTVSSNRKKWVLVGAIVLAVFIGGGVSAYFLDLLPFTLGVNPQELFDKGLGNFTEMESAKYTLNIEIKSVDRDPDAQPFKLILKEPDVHKAQFDRDQNRFRDLRKILDTLGKLYVYPRTLAEAGITLKDPLGTDYVYYPTDNNRDFSLTITFETRDAINSISRSDPNGQLSSTSDLAVTFNGRAAKIRPYFNLVEQRVQPGFFSLQSQSQLLNYIPLNFNLKFLIDGLFDQREEEVTDNQTRFAVDVLWQDSSQNLDVELIKKSDVFYFKLNKIPGLLSGLYGAGGEIKNNWVKVVPDDLNESFGTMDINQAFDKKTKKEIVAEFKLLFELAKNEGVISYTDKPTKERVGGRSTLKYSVHFDRDKLISFYEKAVTEFDQKFGQSAVIKFNPTLVDYLKSDEFDQVYEYIQKNAAVFLWIDIKTMFPAKIAFSDRIVPDDKVIKLKNKQVMLGLEIQLKDVNEDIVVTEPVDYISYEDFVISLRGITKGQYLLEKQTSNIRRIRSALSSYKRYTNHYPDTLDELKKSPSDITGQEPNTLDERESSYKQRLLLSTMPKDTFTGNDFAYRKSGADYELEYQIILPPYKSGSSLVSLRGIYSTRYRNGKSLYALKLINGLNAANEKYSSREAETDVWDSDGDDITDSFELYLGTNPNKKDTDSDGYTDGEELMRGYDPNGPGQLEREFDYY